MTQQVEDARVRVLDDHVGREHAVEGVDEVTRSDVRRKLEVFCFHCPLHTEDAVAQTHGYRRAVAPLALIPLWTMPAYWSSGGADIFAPGTRETDGTMGMSLPPVFTDSVNVASTSEFFEPVYPGDRLKSVAKLVEYKLRSTRLGEGAFLTTETVVSKLSGEKVAVKQNTNFRYDRQAGAVPPPSLEEIAQSQAGTFRAPSPIDWSLQRRFSEATTGDEIPGYSIFLSYQRIVMNVAADRMYSGVHHNRDHARAAGLSDIIFNTRGYEMLMEIALRRWMGLAGRLRKLGPFRMTGNAHPGDILVCNGKVLKTDPEHKVVLLDLTVRSPRGVAASGEALVSLPP